MKDFDLSGRVCYALVKLEIIFKDIKGKGKDVKPQQVARQLWAVENYIEGIRKEIEEKQDED